MDEIEQQQVEQGYEPPQVITVGQFGTLTRGQYSRTHSDDGDAGGYWDNA